MKKKKFTADIDWQVGEDIKALAGKRGQTLSEFTEEEFKNRLRAESFMDTLRSEALKHQIAKDVAA